MAKNKCSVPGCRRRAQVKGLCRAHYRRLQEGRPLTGPIARSVKGPIEKRLRAHVKIDKETDCHIWTRGHLPTGYGSLSVNGLARATHRLAWEVANGPIPEGMMVLHTCDNRRCCNPAHLKLGTHADNMRDMKLKGRGPGSRALDLELHPQWAINANGSRRALGQNRAGKKGVEVEVERPQEIGLHPEDQDDEDHRCHVHAAERGNEPAQRGEQG